MSRRPPAAVVHGGAPPGLIDLSTGLNPLGPSSPVREAVATTTFESYADLDPAAAEARLAADCGVEPARIVLTAGATEGLRLALTDGVSPGDTVVVAGPTYGEYARLASSLGARVLEVRASPPDLAFPLEATREAMASARPSALVVCDPNNPSGARVPATAWELLLAASPSTSVVVDESFVIFTADGAADAPAHPRVTRVRSLTKLHAMPGVRAGFVVAAPELAAAYRDWRDPWSTGSHAIAAARAGGWHLSEVDRSELARLGQALDELLVRHDLPAIGGVLPYRLVRSSPGAASLVDDLRAHGIAVRDTTSMGLPGWFRLRIPTDPERRRLAEALAAISSARSASTHTP